MILYGEILKDASLYFKVNTHFLRARIIIHQQEFTN